MRKFVYNEIKTHYDEEKKAIEKASEGGKGKQTLVSSDGKVNAPEFAKASHQYKQAEKNINKFKGKTSFK